MSYTIIPLLDPAVKQLFSEHPCCDRAHAKDISERSSCTYAKTLVLQQDSTYSVVHARLGIAHGYTIRPPDAASLEMTRRMKTHGDPLVSSQKPEDARVSFSSTLKGAMERCRRKNEDARKEKEAKLIEEREDLGQYFERAPGTATSIAKLATGFGTVARDQRDGGLPNACGAAKII